MIILDASVVVDLLIKPPSEIANIRTRLALSRWGTSPTCSTWR
jgi:predicted nucleic acid-binding protein